MNPSQNGVKNGNSKGLVVLLIISSSLMVFIFLCLLMHALYRRHRRSIWNMYFRLRGLDPNAPENRYPAALPTRQARRFAGVKVVDGNAILTKSDYDRLRAQTPILIQIDDISSAEASEDYSQLDVVTVTTFSRAGSVASARRGGRRAREELEGFGEDAVSNIDLDPVEIEMLEMKEEIARERNRAEFSGTFGADAPTGLKSAMKQVPKGMPKRVKSQHTLDPSTGITIVTAMSREDLHAHLAMEQAREGEQRAKNKTARIAEMLEVPFSPLLSPGVDQDYTSGAWDREPSDVREGDIDEPDWMNESSVSVKKLPHGAPKGSPTMAVEYSFSSPSSEEDGSPADSSPSAAHRRDRSSTASSENSVSLPALSVRSLRSVRFTLPGKEKKKGQETERRKKHSRREVRREVHRHHVNNGGYIICKDDDEEVRRKVSKKKSTTKPEASDTTKRTGKVGRKDKKRFVFQRRPSDEFYGTAHYLPTDNQNE